ncbi:DNA cytosine methyltransferase, partial [Escherichia coli]|nr:DNA cytosine methyltransferase [Escherichia coli]
YGAPTIRTRYFFIGVKKSLKLDISDEVFMPKMIDPVTVKDALYGLPDIIDANWQSDSESWRTIKKDRKGGFYEKLWGQIPRNVGDTESIAKLKNNIISGCTGTLHSKIVQERYASLSFGETDKISRSTRLDPNGFCPTLRAGTARDKGSFQAVRPIHPYHPRVITPREAARLQGFPDWFRFHVTKWHSFRQIGNSVSPIVAEYILKGLYNLLNKRVQPEYLNHNSLEVRV